MLCHNCHKYGHTKARCGRKGVCRNCGEDDYTSEKKRPIESKRANCGEGHIAGSNNSEVERKGYLEKCKLIAEWEDEALFKSWQKISLQDQTLSHTLHFSEAKWNQKKIK